MTTTLQQQLTPEQFEKVSQATKNLARILYEIAFERETERLKNEEISQYTQQAEIRK